MLRFIAPATAAAALLLALPAHAATSAGTYDDTSYPVVESSAAPARDASPIVTADVTYGGTRTAFVNGVASRDESAVRIAYDDTSYPSSAPASAPTPAPAAAPSVAHEHERAPVRMACGCMRRG